MPIKIATDSLHLVLIKMDTPDNCPYCTDTTEHGSIVNFQCGHTVHYTCFIKAVKYNREHNQEIRCPLCRAAVEDAVVPEIFNTVVVPVTTESTSEVFRSTESYEERERPRIHPFIYVCAMLIFIGGMSYIIYEILS